MTLRGNPASKPSTPIAGGTSVRLNPELAATGDVFSFELNRIINVVVFPARESGASTENLWVIPTAGGGSPSKLNFNLPVNDRIIGYAISPFGDKVVYNVATSNDIGNRGYAFVGNLYSTLIGGGVGSVNLTDMAEPYFGVGVFRFTPNGSHVVYEYRKNATSPKRLESSTVQSGVRAALYEPSGSDDPLYSYAISGDSAWVVYTAGGDYESQRLHTIPIGGGSPTGFGPGRNALLTLDHSRVVFSRTTGADSHSDLFSAKIFGGDERNLFRSAGQRVRVRRPAQPRRHGDRVRGVEGRPLRAAVERRARRAAAGKPDLACASAAATGWASHPAAARAALKERPECGGIINRRHAPQRQSWSACVSMMAAPVHSSPSGERRLPPRFGTDAVAPGAIQPTVIVVAAGVRYHHFAAGGASCWHTMRSSRSAARTACSTCARMAAVYTMIIAPGGAWWRIGSSSTAQGRSGRMYVIGPTRLRHPRRACSGHHILYAAPRDVGRLPGGDSGLHRCRRNPAQSQYRDELSAWPRWRMVAW